MAPGRAAAGHPAAVRRELATRSDKHGGNSSIPPQFPSWVPRCFGGVRWSDLPTAASSSPTMATWVRTGMGLAVYRKSQQAGSAASYSIASVSGPSECHVDRTKAAWVGPPSAGTRVIATRDGPITGAVKWAMGREFLDVAVRFVAMDVRPGFSTPTAGGMGAVHAL